MRAIVTAVVAAIEAAAVAFAGFAVVAVPALLLWMVVFGLAAEPAAVMAGIAGVWLLAHWVPTQFEIDAQTALGLGLAPEPIAVVLSLAPLGVTVLTAALAARAGWRFGGRGGSGAAGALGGALGFGAVSFAAATLAAPLAVWPLWLAALVPALCYGAVSTAAFAARAVRDEHGWWRACTRAAQRGVERIGASGAAAVLPARAAETVRLAAASLAALVGIAALALSAAIVVGYPHVIALTQGLHLDPLGSTLVFLVQLALLPVALIWGAAWVTGAGFSVGAGSSATPFEALLGPLPALPLFGAIPQGWGGLGALAPAALVLVGVAVGVLFARRPQQRRASWTAALVTPVLAAALVGLAVAALCGLASGSLGPGRLETVGADPWLAGGLAAAELGGGLLLGVSAARIDLQRIRAALPEAVKAVNERVRPPRAGEGSRGAAEGLPVLDGLDRFDGGIRRSAGRAAGGESSDDETVDLSDAALVDSAGRAPHPGAPRGPEGATRSAGSAALADAAGSDAFDTEAYDADAFDTEAYGTEGYDSDASGGAAVDGPAAEGDGADAGPAETGDADAHDADNGDPHDTEALLRAYSWDERQTGAGDPEPPRPTRRWGRRKR
ncbi:hypothetical protein Leucomu_04475 [Leucobacter muris]|uniref:Integral membrane protein n=1 Tax=Leucobacter muris TaxID=1935379 RepID=A0ABX5QDY6_9MICO|nr:DUF6350 family protein [Leucobacter muris]QAB17279.1 hypothetical protein Leucomu_04475 [Leucobacter muris]